MWHELQEELELELAQLKALIASFRPLLLRVETNAPDIVETVSLAGFLHSFYTGMENALKRIAVHVDGELPAGRAWHSQLLDKLAQSHENRPAVLSHDLHETLLQYLSFRHVFRHAYSFELKWTKMAPLAANCEQTFSEFETDLRSFLTQLGVD